MNVSGLELGFHLGKRAYKEQEGASTLWRRKRFGRKVESGKRKRVVRLRSQREGILHKLQMSAKSNENENEKNGSEGAEEKYGG